MSPWQLSFENEMPCSRPVSLQKPYPEIVHYLAVKQDFLLNLVMESPGQEEAAQVDDHPKPCPI
jgi:hypothetical protein